jgi:hypothetical protein
VALAKKTVDDFRAQNKAELDKDLAPGLAALMADRALVESMLAVFPHQPVASVHVEAWSSLKYLGNVLGRETGQHSKDPLTRLTLRYEFQGGDAVRVNVVLAPHDGRLRVNKLNLVPLVGAEIAHNSLSAHWDSVNERPVFVLIALGVVGFIVWTAVNCLRTPGLRFKWLWFLVIILLNAVQVTMDWTTAKVYVLPLIVRFPPFWIHQPSAYDPAMIWFLLPIGAIAFRTWLMMGGTPIPPPRQFG